MIGPQSTQGSTSWPSRGLSGHLNGFARFAPWGEMMSLCIRPRVSVYCG